MNKIKKCLTSTAFLSSFIFAPAYAGGDMPVNCRVESIGFVDLFSGVAQCLATAPGTSSVEFLSQFIPPQPSSVAFLNEVRFVDGRSVALSCTAPVPFFGTEEVFDEVCDFTPQAFLDVDAFSAGEVFVRARGSDRDGTVTVQLVIDGVVQNSTIAYLDIFTGGYSIGQAVQVEAIVTDNDGHVTRALEVAVIEGGDINITPTF